MSHWGATPGVMARCGVWAFEGRFPRVLYARVRIRKLLKKSFQTPKRHSRGPLIEPPPRPRGHCELGTTAQRLGERRSGEARYWLFDNAGARVLRSEGGAASEEKPVEFRNLIDPKNLYAPAIRYVSIG